MWKKICFLGQAHEDSRVYMFVRFFYQLLKNVYWIRLKAVFDGT